MTKINEDQLSDLLNAEMPTNCYFVVSERVNLENK